MKTPPKSAADQRLMVKLFFFLLPAGISQLNKAGHPEISEFVARMPDRVFAWSVTGDDELASYLRVKAGNSKSGRGRYERSRPFVEMKFDSIETALGILLATADMTGLMKQGKFTIEGAQEYGKAISDFMLIVGSLAS